MGILRPLQQVLRAMISDDFELEDVVGEVSAGLQDIQNYMGDRNSNEAKVRFPRGYIRTATHHRRGLGFLEYEDSKNISYSMQSYDILRWISNRTDLNGPAKNLVCRMAIVILGSVAEGLAVKGTQGKIGKTVKFKERLRRMHEDSKIINKALRDDLGWLWDQRNSIHLDRITDPHIDLFNERDVNRANRIVKRLRERLAGWHASN